MRSKLFIPKKLCIGFQSRDNTMAGDLAYITYFDEKGKLRRSASWQNWQGKDRAPIEVDNIPRSGYLVNKEVKHFNYHSGYYGSSSERVKVRIYSPDNFEFEITPENICSLIAVANINMREICTECVFAWETCRS